MSQSLSLVEYKADKDGNLYEDDCQVIESAFITPEVINSIEEQRLLEDKKLLEEPGATESSVRVDVRTTQNKLQADTVEKRLKNGQKPLQ